VEKTRPRRLTPRFFKNNDAIVNRISSIPYQRAAPSPIQENATKRR
jgi:hypothetical protein